MTTIVYSLLCFRCITLTDLSTIYLDIGMPSILQHHLISRSHRSDNHYPIIFAVLGSVIVMCGVFWGCILPKWDRNNRRSAQTRYNSTVTKTDLPARASRDSFVFPPHPAVVLPLNKDRLSAGQARECQPTVIPIYDPRTRSPFSSTPRTWSCQPLRPNVVKTGGLGLPTTRGKNSQNDNSGWRRSRPHQGTELTHYDAPPKTTSDLLTRSAASSSVPARTAKKFCLVPRSAGLPPQKPKAARLAAKNPIFRYSRRRNSSAFPSSISAAGGQELGRTPFPDFRDHQDVNGKSIYDQDPTTCVPNSVDSGVLGIVRFPNLVEIATPTKSDMSARATDNDFSPPEMSAYPGISKLVPSRRLKYQVPLSRTRGASCIDTNLETKTTLQTDEIDHSRTLARDAPRPVSGARTLPVEKSYLIPRLAPPVSRSPFAMIETKMSSPSKLDIEVDILLVTLPSTLTT